MMPFQHDPRAAAEQSAGDSRNQAIRDLQRALVRFGHEFGLLEGATCDCDNPNCINRDVETMTLERLLDWVSDAWHAQAGCGHDEDGEPEDTGDTEAVRRRNLMLVNHFAYRLGAMSDDCWRRVEERFAILAEAPLFRDADALVAHGLETMFPGYEDEPGPAQAVTVAEEWTDSRDEPQVRAQNIVDAVRCAVCALLAYAIADRRLIDALYEPFAMVIPMNELIVAARRDLPAS